MTSNVHAFSKDGRVTKEALIQMGSDPEVSGFVVGVLWKDGTVTTGWGGGLTNAELTYITAAVEDDIKHSLFGDTR